MRQFPIIMPAPNRHAERECIVVDSHRYCREEAVTSREAGVVILICSLALAYVGLIVWQAIDRDDFRIVWAGLLIPAVLFSLYLIF